MAFYNLREHEVYDNSEFVLPLLHPLLDLFEQNDNLLLYQHILTFYASFYASFYVFFSFYLQRLQWLDKD